MSRVFFPVHGRAKFVTRFAPSPTGFLHIGGGRTALFNWLYARRPRRQDAAADEDTDRERSTKAAIDAILDGLAWLGIDWDGDVIYQFARAARHREVVEKTAGRGPGLSLLRIPAGTRRDARKSRSEGRSKLYDGRWRDRDPAEAAAGVKPVIRLRAPLTGETGIEDQVQGRVVWQNEHLDDLVLLRSDGTPTYMLAVVVRRPRHGHHSTSSAATTTSPTGRGRPRSTMRSAGKVPVMAHIPLIHDRTDQAFQAPRRARRRCLPRHGLPAGGDAQLPGAARLEPRRPGNLLHPGDGRGVRLPQIGRSPARFDFAKLESLNGHYLRQNERCRSRHRHRAPAAAPRQRGRPRGQVHATAQGAVAAAMPGLQKSARKPGRTDDSARFLYATARSQSTTRRRCCSTRRRAPSSRS